MHTDEEREFDEEDMTEEVDFYDDTNAPPRDQWPPEQYDRDTAGEYPRE